MLDGRARRQESGEARSASRAGAAEPSVAWCVVRRRDHSRSGRRGWRSGWRSNRSPSERATRTRPPARSTGCEGARRPDRSTTSWTAAAVGVASSVSSCAASRWRPAAATPRSPSPGRRRGGRPIRAAAAERSWPWAARSRASAGDPEWARPQVGRPWPARGRRSNQTLDRRCALSSRLRDDGGSVRRPARPNDNTRPPSERGRPDGGSAPANHIDRNCQ